MHYTRQIDPATGQPFIATSLRGAALLANPLLNKGTAFTRAERSELALAGLIPPAVCSIEEQLQRAYESYQRKPTPIERYVYLAGLHDRNETLFFRLVLDHIDEMMPIVYTPVVGEACQKFSHIYRRSRGLYLAYDRRHQMEEILSNFECADAPVIVVTDGERILGLGDQGAGGMGIPIGKLCLYTLCAGVTPDRTLPIMLDVGTDNEERLEDPLYLGLRQKRVRGADYQAFIDRFVDAVQNVFPHALLQWEDFLKENALHQLERFRDRICSFNDDIQGTAGVVVAGIYSGLRITGQAMRDQRIVFAGAGASAQGISALIMAAMTEQGMSLEEARRRIWTVDSRGLVTTDRPKLEAFKAAHARDPRELEGWSCADRGRISLEETVAHAKPTILVGTSATPGLFTEKVVRCMAEINERPMIFPLSNPTSKTECSAEEAIRWSGGRAIVATGSPFDPVHFEGRTHRIGQGNNAFVFPGLGLGIVVGRVRRVTDGMFLAAAHALAEQVSPADLAETAVYPELTRIRECSHAVACGVIRRAVQDGYADAKLLEGLEERVRAAMWYPEYLPCRPA